MRLWHIVRTTLRTVFRRRQRELELDEELQLHIDREVERMEALGLATDAARQQALRQFGGVAQVRESCRDARNCAPFDALLRDTQHAVRRLARDWPFTLAAVLILGLGIGANTALFTAINAMLFRTQSVARADGLVDIYQTAINPGGIDANSYPAYLDMAAYTDIFAGITAVTVPHGVSYRDGGALRPAVVEHTTASYPAVLGLRPSLGRWFTDGEDAPGVPIVVVLSHTAWTRKFGADPTAVGRTIRIEGTPATIVGVGPVGHNATLNAGLVTDFWLPIASMAALGAPPRVLERKPDEAAFFVKARLRDGVTAGHAQAAMQALGTRLASEYPKDDPGRGIRVFASKDVRIHPQIDALLTPVASVLAGLVGLVLAIACSNLATLLLVRATARAKEVSIRLALGATRRQLVGHLLAESLLLSLAGGAAGCVLAWWTLRWLTTIDLPVVVDLAIDLRVFGFALVLSVFTGIAFGLAPALKASRVNVVPALRDETGVHSPERRWLTLRNGLVVFQVAVSVVLLGTASLFLQAMAVSRNARVGFAVDGVAMLQTDARYAGYSTTDVRQRAEDVRQRIAAIPGVQAAVLTRGLPMQANGARIVVDGDTTADRVVPAVSVWAGEGYFDALQIPIVHGRAFDERDRPDTPRVAIISETMATQYFGTVNAVGRRFRFEPDSSPWFEVIGIARDTGTADRMGDIVDPTPQLFYRSFTQAAQLPDTVLARTSLDASALARTMQRELRTLDATLPIVAVKTMRQYLDDSLAGTGTAAALLIALGGLGLCLAGIGLHAVIAFSVARRTREIGIRMALGARSSQVVGAVARDAALLVAFGTIAGTLLSLLVIQVLRATTVSTPGVSLYRPTVDPAALLAIAAFMAVVGLAAAYVPARRAAHVDPLIALRHD